MSEPIDWEKRARELLFPRSIDGPSCRALDKIESAAVRDALQLGREMADARAEEIAQRCEGLATRQAADIARSTIKKPEPPKTRWKGHFCLGCGVPRRTLVHLGGAAAENSVCGSCGNEIRTLTLVD